MVGAQTRRVSAGVVPCLAFSATILAAALPGDAATIYVNAGGDVQAAVNAASAGDTIVLQSGVTFTQSIVLPTTQHATPVTIRSSTIMPNRRMTAADAANMAKLRPGHPSEPVIYGAGVKGWTFQGVQLDSPGGIYNFVELSNVNLGGGSFRNTDNVTFDRIVIIGGNPYSARNALAVNGSNITVTKSHIANIRRPGEETKAIVVQEGPGPFTVTDNFLEAAMINILFGGGWIQSSAHVPNNIRVEGNHLFKNPAWKDVFATKNIFELKNATNVTVRNNLMENNWIGGQDGTAILFQPVNDCACPNNKITDVVFEQNVVRGADRGISVLGYEWQPEYSSGQTTRITFRNNLFVVRYRFLLTGGEVGVMTFDHNTVDMTDGDFLIYMYFGGVHPAGQNFRNAKAAVQNFTFTNNITKFGLYGMSAEDSGGGTVGLEAKTDTYTWTHNVMAGAPSGQSYPLTNFYPSISAHQAQFNADYTLVPGSTYRGAASDGKDLGRIAGSSGTAPAVTAPALTAPTGVRLIQPQ